MFGRAIKKWNLCLYELFCFSLRLENIAAKKDNTKFGKNTAAVSSCKFHFICHVFNFLFLVRVYLNKCSTASI